MRTRVLLPLTAAVLAAHVWLLWQLPAWSGAQDPQPAPSAPAFTTRSIAPPAPAAAPPRPQARPRPQPVRPMPVRPEQVRPMPVRPLPPQPELPAPVPADAAAADAAPADAAAAGAAAAETPASVTEAAAVDLPGETPPPAQPPAAAAGPADPPAARPATLQGVQFVAPGGQAPLADVALPVKLPAPARLTFDVAGQAKGFDYHAGAELLWQHDGHGYQLRQQIKAFLVGSRAQTSSGLVTESGLVPQRFSDQGRSEKSAEFDFAAEQARFTPAAPPAPIGAGAQDRISVFLQLSALLAAAPGHYPSGSEITFTTVGSSDAQRWTFRVQDSETLELPLGAVPALRLERLPRHAGDQQATLWLAPSLGYLPARIRLTQANGDFADLRLQAQAAP